MSHDPRECHLTSTAPGDGLVFPASFAQQRLWFLHQYAPESPVYNVVVSFRLTGHLNVAALQGALNVIMSRHETLRTSFALRDGELIQVVAAASPWELHWVDLQETPAPNREKEVQKRVNEEIRIPFQLARGPLVRSALFRLGANEHVFLATLHHIISDGWSAGVFYRELGDLYARLATGQSPQLPELPIQYADYAVWQRDWLRGEVFDRQAAYWGQRLAGAPPFLALPTDRRRPQVESFRGEDLRLVLEPQLSHELNRLARQEQATLFMLLVTAFNVLLFRYTGQTDIVVGTPIANRNREEVEGLIGFFVNTLALRTTLSDNPSFLELLRRVKAATLDDYAHQDLPFEKLVEELQVERDASRSPLFQVMFALQNFETRCPQLMGLDIAPFPFQIGTAHFDLTMFMEPRENDLEVVLEYNTDLFNRDRMERFLGHWRTLLEGITAQPQARLTELPWLSPVERVRILEEWNDTTVAFPSGGAVQRMFEQQMTRTPNAMAVLAGERVLSYAELNRRANELAHHLRDLQVRPDEPVGLYLDRSLEQMVGLLGILKAGAGYLPLDPGYPAERLAGMVADSGCRLVVTQRSLAGGLSVTPARLVLIEELPDGLAQDNPELRTRPNHLAYLMYTSGSTGRPKGVAMEHQALMNLLNWQVRQSAPGLRTLQFASVSFDVSFQEVFSTWLSGGTLVLITPELRWDPAALWDFVVDQRVERLFLPVVLLEHLAESARRSERRAEALREIFTAGEQLRITPAIQAGFEKQPALTLHNHYGPTEAHVVTAYALPANVALWPVLPPIGRPIANVKIHILDPNGQPVPAGVTGELYIGGAALARGYWGQPELTGKKFMRDPFSADPSARLYRTGDLAAYLPDGNIEFLGRVDHQVKVRGSRVELTEIETVLLAHSAVREAVVMLREDVLGDKRLAAFVTPQIGVKLTVEDLRSHLARQLPDYMWPSSFVLLEKLPLTTNGKVDRSAVLKLEIKDEPAGKRPGIARNLLEHRLVELWEGLLGRKNIGPDDNFFDLGGNSLLAARLLSEIERLVGRRVPLATLFHAPSVARMARAIEDQGAVPAWSSLVPLQPKGTRPPFFFTHGWGGDVFGYVPLARLLGSDQPVYGLQAVGLDGSQSRHGSVEEMAAYYVQEMHALQPEGPYYIGGFSCGGLIAYEVAQQLIGLGQKVGLLAFLDTYIPCPELFLPWPELIRRKARNLKRRWPIHQAELVSLPFRQKVLYVFRQLAKWLRWIAETQQRRTDPVQTNKSTRPAAAPPEDDYYNQLTRRYRPRIYPGRLTLLRVQDHPHLILVDPSADWRYLAGGGFEIREIPGGHLALLDSTIMPQWAAQLQQCLVEAQTQAHPPR